MTIEHGYGYTYYTGMDMDKDIDTCMDMSTDMDTGMDVDMDTAIRVVYHLSLAHLPNRWKSSVGYWFMRLLLLSGKSSGVPGYHI